MIFFKKHLSLWVLVTFCLSFSDARIRLRKVKEAPRVCAMMTEDKLLSRQDKKVLSTERHSLVFEEGITLLRDKGEKICNWRLTEFDTIAPLEQFHFYIDEYKEFLYPFVKTSDGSITAMKVSLSDCNLDDKKSVVKFDLPQCEKPKKSVKKKRRKVTT